MYAKECVCCAYVGCVLQWIFSSKGSHLKATSLPELVVIVSSACVWDQDAAASQLASAAEYALTAAPAAGFFLECTVG